MLLYLFKLLILNATLDVILINKLCTVIVYMYTVYCLLVIILLFEHQYFLF